MKRIVVGLLVVCVPLIAVADDWSKVFEQYQARVERSRGLAFKGPVTSRSLTRDQYRELQALNFQDTYPNGPEATESSWRALGLLAPDGSLRRQNDDFRNTQVQGFYMFDGLTEQYPEGSLYLIPENGGDNDEVAGHELVHALNDQHHDLGKIQDSLPRTVTGEMQADRERAFMALEEGVATVVGREVERDLNGGGFHRMAASPFAMDDWVRARSQFLYVEGEKFVEAVRDRRGWEGVNDAYRQLPQSTEQIMHPERFLRDRPDLPSEVTIADTSRALPGDWERVQVNSLGELGAAWLTHPEAGEGWDGDQYEVIHDRATGQTIGNMFTTWDTAKDAAEFRLSSSSLPRPMRGLDDGELVFVEQRGNEVFMASGVTEDQIPALRDAAWRGSRVVKDPNDNDARPGGLGPVDDNAVFRIMETATEGVSVSRAGATDAAVNTVGTWVLSPEGRGLAEQAIAKLRELAGTEGSGIIDQGNGRFGFEGEGTILQYRDGALTLAAGEPDAIRDLERILNELPPAGSSEPLDAVEPQGPADAYQGATGRLKNLFGE